MPEFLLVFPRKIMKNPTFLRFFQQNPTFFVHPPGGPDQLLGRDGQHGFIARLGGLGATKPPNR
jgi:hypothetical protein